jgi:hypothetical protein
MQALDLDALFEGPEQVDASFISGSFLGKGGRARHRREIRHRV